MTELFPSSNDAKKGEDLHDGGQSCNTLKRRSDSDPVVAKCYSG